MPPGFLVSVSDQRDRTYQPVAFANDCLQEPGVFWVVAQRPTNLADRGINALPGVEENILSPEFFDDLRTADELVFPLRQQDKQLHRNLFQTKHPLAPTKLVAYRIELE